MKPTDKNTTLTTTDTTKLPLAVYTRTSTKGDADDNRRQSHAEQRARVAKYAEAHGLLLLDEEFTDDHKSGGQMDDRPALDAAVRAVADGRAGGIVVAFLDRLSRSSEQGQRFIRELGKVNSEAVVVAVDLSLTITPSMSAVSKFMFQNLLSTAEYVRNALGERIESAKARAIREGVLVGVVPVGYRQVGHPDKPKVEWNDAERQLVVDEPVADAIRELFRRRADGAGYGALAKWFDTQGVIPWRVREEAAEHGVEPQHRWTRQGIAGVLRNEFYVTGQIAYGDILGPKVEPIVDRATFELARQAAGERRPAQRANPNSRWLTTGLLRCKHCQRSMAPTTGSKAQGAKRRYRCVNRACPAAEKGSRVSIDAGYIERVVVAEALKRGDKLVGTPVEEVDLTADEAELEKAERLLQQASTAEAQEALGDQWLPTVAERRAARDEKAAEVARKRQEAGLGQATTYRLATIWEDLTPEQQRTALAWYFEAVLIDRPSVPGRGRGRKEPIKPEYREGDIVFVTRHTRPWQPIEWQPLTLAQEQR